VAPEITAELKPLAESDQFRWLQKGYDDGDLKGRELVIGITAGGKNHEKVKEIKRKIMEW